MNNPPNTLCAKCFKSLKSQYIVCHICRAKFHHICARVEEKFCEMFSNNKNIVFNCDDCRNVSSNMVEHISSLTNEVRELKHSIMNTQTICEDLKILKLKFDDLVSNLGVKKTKLPKKQQTSEHLNNNNAVGISAAGDSVNSATAETTALNSQHFLSAASSVSSLPTVASSVLNGPNTFEDNTQPVQKANDWVRVQRRRRNRQPVIHGSNISDELEVVAQKKWVHLSSFKSNVTSDQIISYVEQHTEFGKEHMDCYKLVKKDTDVNLLKKVNFKLGISPCFYDEILNSKLWPTGIRVRPFVNFPRMAKPTDLL